MTQKSRILIEATLDRALQEAEDNLYRSQLREGNESWRTRFQNRVNEVKEAIEAFKELSAKEQANENRTDR